MAKTDYLERPTREEIALLPPFPGLSLHQIVVPRSQAHLDDAFRSIERERFVGFDTETKPTFTKGTESTGPHVVQLALRDRAYVLQLGDAPPMSFLRAVIESSTIVKVGFGLKSDRGPLHRKLGIALGAAVELTATLRTLRYKQALGAKAAVAIVLGQKLRKSKSVATSNWAAPVLKPNKLLYAANDAYAALCVFRALGSPYAPFASPMPGEAGEGGSSGDHRR